MKQLRNLVTRVSMQDFAQPHMSWKTKRTLRAVFRDAKKEQDKILRQAKALQKAARAQKKV